MKEINSKEWTNTGDPTGFSALDRLTGGLRPSDLILVAGMRGTGKTSFVLDIVRYVSMVHKNPVPVGLFSLGMPKKEIVMRLLSSESEINYSKLQIGAFSGQEWPKLSGAAGTLTEARMFIDDSPALTVMELRTRARRLKMEHEIGLIVIDYIQLMQGRAGTDLHGQEIVEILQALKVLAKELKIPVVAIFQLDRTPQTTEKKIHRPCLTDLPKSGALEKEADTILFVHRAEACNNVADYKEAAEIIVAKQRNGLTGTVTLSVES